jgi:hypothetical protein
MHFESILFQGLLLLIPKELKTRSHPEYVNSEFDEPISTFDLAAVNASPDELEVEWCFLNGAHISVFYLEALINC